MAGAELRITPFAPADRAPRRDLVLAGLQAEIMRMSVARRHRRMGIGEAILDHLVATASRRGVRTLVLETSTAWSDAVDFYLRRGFGITHRIEDGPDPSTFLRRDIGQP